MSDFKNNTEEIKKPDCKYLRRKIFMELKKEFQEYEPQQSKRQRH